MNSKTQNFLYIAFVDKSEAGVYQKVKAQFAAFRSFYKHAQLLILSNKDVNELDIENGIETVNCYHKNPFVRRQIKINRIQSKLNSLAVIGAGGLRVYFRYPGADYFMYKLLKRNSSLKWILEHQSISSLEYLNSKNHIGYINEKFWSRSFFKLVSLHVFIHKDIPKYYNINDNYVVMNNGISVDKVKLKVSSNTSNEKLNLLFVGSIQRWHGLDLLIEEISKSEYKSMLNFNIVGSGPEMDNLKKLVVKNNLDSVVIFHGHKSGKELEIFFDNNDIAVGSLAIERAGIGSPLKTREYCARGIPFVDGVADDDFSDDFPFRLRLGVRLDLEKIVAFARQVKSEKEVPQRMRAYAKERLDWKIKIEEVAMAIEKV